MSLVLGVAHAVVGHVWRCSEEGGRGDVALACWREGCGEGGDVRAQVLLRVGEDGFGGCVVDSLVKVGLRVSHGTVEVYLLVITKEFCIQKALM